MENTQTPIFEVLRELFHALLGKLVHIRIKDKPFTTDTHPTNCIEIAHNIRVVEKQNIP
ncbi:MAG: hypothetical protein IM598_10635 [Chitinophagaceae bacterium]|nr:hypothetical protein [Chitinophagaceae bacterium]MCA6465273.1 hypothetical protein [Chitinophagaceae bacterium]